MELYTPNFYLLCFTALGLIANYYNTNKYFDNTKSFERNVTQIIIHLEASFIFAVYEYFIYYLWSNYVETDHMISIIILFNLLHNPNPLFCKSSNLFIKYTFSCLSNIISVYFVRFYFKWAIIFRIGYETILTLLFFGQYMLS